MLLSQGPFRQLAAGTMGVCAITGSDDEEEAAVTAHLAPPDQMQCWGRAKDMIDVSKREGWDQVTLGCCGGCAVSLQSHLDCWGHGMPSTISQDLRDFVVA